MIGPDVSAAIAVCAAALAILIAVSGPHGRWVSAVGAIARESALVLGLFATWQVAGRLARTRVDGAFTRGNDIWTFERRVHLPSELALQHALLPHPWLVRGFNGYYLYGHLNVMIFTLIWLFARHRDQYPAIRTTLALSSAACLLVQLVPVAPPRMFPGLGFRDTALDYGQSVYGPMGSGIANQLSAMPSLHIGWAVIAAMAVVRSLRSPWRWLAVVHPLLMSAVVAGTANHWHLDGIVATAIVFLTVVGLRGVERVRRRSRSPLSVDRPAAVAGAAAV